MLKLGSSGLMAGAWQRTMVRRFGSYAKAADGGPLKADRYFGYDDQAVQREYQRRTGQVPNGEVSDNDLHRLGLLVTLVSIHGTGQPDPIGIGYPADIARRCLDLYMWKPLGNWPAQAVPMDGSVEAGVREGLRFHNDPLIIPGPVAYVDYSQGSIIGGRLRNRIRAGLRGELITAVSFGNPMRPHESYIGTVDPGGSGIDPDHEPHDARCINLAAKGDLYTTCPDGNVGEMERAIFNAVFRRWTGKDSVPEQLWEMITNPIPEIAAAGKALWNGGLFVLRGTGPHTSYHLNECPGTGVTYYEFAIEHLRDVATARLEKLVA